MVVMEYSNVYNIANTRLMLEELGSPFLSL